MAHRKKRGPLMGNHQKCWLWGRNLILETLTANRWPIHELYLADRLSPPELKHALRIAEAAGIDTRVEPASKLANLAHTREHQGYVAKMGRYPYANETEILQNASGTPLFIILDCMQDPYNFGAVVRCAEVFCATAVFIGTQNQAEVSSQVARSSAGAVNRVPIARVAELTDLIAGLKKDEVQLIAASEKSDQPIYSCNLSGPTAFVIGNEGTGITPQIQAACDGFATIPLQGELGSLNAAVAAGILLYEARRQRS